MRVTTTTQEETEAVNELMGLKAWPDIDGGISADLDIVTFREAFEEVDYFRDLYDSFTESFDNAEVGSIFDKYPAKEVFEEVQTWLDRYRYLVEGPKRYELVLKAGKYGWMNEIVTVRNKDELNARIEEFEANGHGLLFVYPLR